jgi:hypothetical protein
LHPEGSLREAQTALPMDPALLAIPCDHAI